MFSCRIAILTLVLIPTMASAQRRMRGETRANWDAVGDSPSGPRVNKTDIESFSAIRIMVDKRKDLKLSDEQLKRLKELDKAEQGRNLGQFKTFDSLRAAARPRAGAPADEERARTTIAREELGRVIEEIRDSYDSTMKDGLLVLDESQQKAATDIVAKEREEAEENLREKFGARGSGTGRGRSGARGRPAGRPNG